MLKKKIKKPKIVITYGLNLSLAEVPRVEYPLGIIPGKGKSFSMSSGTRYSNGKRVLVKSV